MNTLQLDAATLVLCSALLTASTAAMAFVMVRANPAGAAAARSWAWAMVAAASAFLFWFVGRGSGRWPDFLVGNTAVVVYCALHLRSIHLLTHRPLRAAWLMALVVLGTSGIVLVALASAPRGFAVVSIALAFLWAGLGSIVAIARDRSMQASGWGKAIMLVMAVWCLGVIGGRLYALIDEGAQAVRPMSSSDAQILSLFAANLMIVVVSVGLFAILADQQRQAAMAAARQDGLTGAFTRAAFFEQAQERMAQVRLYSVVMLDVDHFKKINDSHGHLVGDAVLRHVVAQMLRQVRSADLVGRYGGEEFCVLLPDCDTAEALRVAERICEESALHPARLPDGRSVTYTVSIGVATAHAHEGRSTAALVGTIDRADRALYLAKAAGRNQVQVFTLPAA